MAEKKKKKEEYTEKDKREGMTELQTGTRVFDTEKYGLVQIRFPGVEENRLADWEYSKIFHKAIMEDIPTNREMEDVIKKKKLWTKKDDEEIQSLNEELQKQLVVLSKMESDEHIEEAEEKVEEVRDELVRKQQEYQRYFNNTAESKADEAKMSFLIYKCTEHADDGKRLWKKYEDFKDEKDQESVNKIVYEFITFINGLPADMLEDPSEEESEEEEGQDSEE